MSDAILFGIAPNIIRSIAITQKDFLPTILAIGARYFEFRPAHLHKAVLPIAQIPDRLYFMHDPIPGIAVDHFLYDCIAFLMAHPLEIIVVLIRWDGAPAECARPNDEELAGYIKTALQSSNDTIITESLDDMTKLISQLSSYDDASNATLNGDSIIAAFDRKSSTAAEDGKALCYHGQCVQQVLDV
ncbi:PLC-like phosphodiesterase [Venturia nashicola]|uniref:PLC-like phosphodiesterase n=1 Tax=Venturia nashicola TaxID=86259 RepID=A0A4Z1PDD9_9PEZI|nr:PLC-like phosphodiesterase [Venturia nashicola]